MTLDPPFGLDLGLVPPLLLLERLQQLIEGGWINGEMVRGQFLGPAMTVDRPQNPCTSLDGLDADTQTTPLFEEDALAQMTKGFPVCGNFFSAI